MEKLDKKKVLAVVLIIALIAALVSAAALLYNAIDMYNNTTFYNYSSYTDYLPELRDCYYDCQEPLATITLVASLIGFLSVASGITSFIVKKPVLKIVVLAISVIAMVGFIVLIVEANGVWTNFYNEYTREIFHVIPNYVALNETIAQMFVIYSGVMSALVPEFVFLTVIAVTLATAYIIDLIKAKANAKRINEVAIEETNDINSENKGEEFNG